MRILAIDSTATSASVAITQDGVTLTCRVEQNGLTHSELLLPMIEEALRETNLTFADIDLYAVSAGPGSFTGVRIGVATIKGLAFGTEKPCVGVSTLESLGENLRFAEGCILSPVMDARRGQVYNALFTVKNGELVRLTPDRAIPLTELILELKETYPDLPIYLSGDGYTLGYKALKEAGLPVQDTPDGVILQNGASIAACAARAYGRGEWVTERDLNPVYLRLPQAERDRLAKEHASKEKKE